MNRYLPLLAAATTRPWHGCLGGTTILLLAGHCLPCEPLLGMLTSAALAPSIPLDGVLEVLGLYAFHPVLWIRPLPLVTCITLWGGCPLCIFVD